MAYSSPFSYLGCYLALLFYRVSVLQIILLLVMDEMISLYISLYWRSSLWLHRCCLTCVLLLHCFSVWRGSYIDCTRFYRSLLFPRFARAGCIKTVSCSYTTTLIFGCLYFLLFSCSLFSSISLVWYVKPGASNLGARIIIIHSTHMGCVCVFYLPWNRLLSFTHVFP